MVLNRVSANLTRVSKSSHHILKSRIFGLAENKAGLGISNFENESQVPAGQNNHDKRLKIATVKHKLLFPFIKK